MEWATRPGVRVTEITLRITELFGCRNGRLSISADLGAITGFGASGGWDRLSA